MGRNTTNFHHKSSRLPLTESHTECPKTLCYSHNTRRRFILNFVHITWSVSSCCIRRTWHIKICTCVLDWLLIMLAGWRAVLGMWAYSVSTEWWCHFDHFKVRVLNWTTSPVIHVRATLLCKQIKSGLFRNLERMPLQKHFIWRFIWYD